MGVLKEQVCWLRFLIPPTIIRWSHANHPWGPHFWSLNSLSKYVPLSISSFRLPFSLPLFRDARAWTCGFFYKKQKQKTPTLSLNYCHSPVFNCWQLAKTPVSFHSVSFNPIISQQRSPCKVKAEDHIFFARRTKDLGSSFSAQDIAIYSLPWWAMLYIGVHVPGRLLRGPFLITLPPLCIEATSY